MKHLVAILLLALNLTVFGQEPAQVQLQDKVQECIQNLPEEVQAQLKVIEQEMKQVQECKGDKKQELQKIAAKKQEQLKEQVQELPEEIKAKVEAAIKAMNQKMEQKQAHLE